MFISRTPFRISFFGGGTDYPSWIEKHGGAVIGTSINHYNYITCRHLPPFFEHNYRVAYSITETTKTIHEIKHPVVNAVLKEMGFENTGLEIHYDADLPARSGLGSSSAFTAGLLNALNALQGNYISHRDLAEKAIYIEQTLLQEVVGAQDQILTSYGGFNRVDFEKNGSTTISPIIAPPERIEELQNHLMLFFTGFSRFASEVAKSKVENFDKKTATLHRMRTMVDEAMDIVQNIHVPITEFGKLLHEAWECKRSLSDKVSSSAIDDIYQKGREGGAIGGKLLGAGGGGFMLFFVPPEKKQDVKAALSPLLHIPFRFESEGSRIVLYQPSGLAPEPQKEFASNG